MKSFLILSLFLYFVSPQDILTFRRNGSVARYAEWHPGSAGRIRFQFRTRFDNKTLFQISSENTSWSVRFERDFVVREYRLNSQSDRELTAEETIPDLQILEDSWVSFKVRLTNRSISFQVLASVISLPVTSHSDTFRWSLGADLDNFIGCIKNVQTSNESSHFYSIQPISFRNVIFGDNCATKCNQNSCVHGRCLESYESAVCDCSGTVFSGDRCEIDISDTGSQRYSFLNQSDSIIELAPWRYYPGGKLRLQFATIHTSIPILTLSANQMRVSCRIDSRGQVRAELVSLSTLIGQVTVPNLRVTGNSWVTLSLTFVPAGISVKVSSGGVNQSAVLRGDWTGRELVPLLGKSPTQSGQFVGCMKGFRVWNDSAKWDATVLRSAGVLVGARCANRCHNVSCGEGVCVNGWSGHFCDCSQTLRSGALCSEDSNQIGLFGNESADFHLDQNSRIDGLSLMFRSLSERGTLLVLSSSRIVHSSNLLTAVLTLQSAVLKLDFYKNILRISVNVAGNEHSIDISALLWSVYSSENWNFVGLKFERNSIIFSVNGISAILTTGSWDWYSDRVEIGSGMIGCFSQLIINRFQELSASGVRSAGGRNSCPSHTSLSVYIPSSQAGSNGLSVNNVLIKSRLVILQLEFLLAGAEVTSGLMFLSLPLLGLQLAVRITQQTVTMTSSDDQLESKIRVRDLAWHKLELVLRSGGNSTLIRLAVDSHSESQVFATEPFQTEEHLIGQLRFGDDRVHSLGGCIRNAVLFGHELSIASLISDRAGEYSLNSCPTVTACDFTPCANGASCSSRNESFLRCDCVTKYSGEFCTNSTAVTQLPVLTPILTFLLPISVSMCLLIVATAVVLSCILVRRCRRGGGSYLTREETGITLMQETRQPNTPVDMFLSPFKLTQEWPV